MISVSEIINDPDLAQAFTIVRSASGTFQLGGYVAGTPQNIVASGVIQPASDNDLEQVPEGDRVTGLMACWCLQELYETGAQGLSDMITWQAQQYKVIAVKPWVDFGYWKAILKRMSGQ